MVPVLEPEAERTRDPILERWLALEAMGRKAQAASKKKKKKAQAGGGLRLGSVLLPMAFVKRK